MIRLSDTAKQSIVWFLLVVGSFALLSYRTQQQDSDIRDLLRLHQIKVYDDCLIRKNNIEVFNKTFQRIHDSEQTNPFINDDLRAVRLSIYTDAKFKDVECGKNPRVTVKDP